MKRIAVLLFLFAASSLWAMQPPRPGEIERLKAHLQPGRLYVIDRGFRDFRPLPFPREDPPDSHPPLGRPYLLRGRDPERGQPLVNAPLFLLGETEHQDLRLAFHMPPKI